MKFKVLDLFCGAGGFSAGLDDVKDIETVIGVDFDKYAMQTFANNFPKAISICGDLTDSEIKNEVINQALKKGVNMIVGGPPCQGFSLKGKNLGLEDSRNFLFMEYFDIVKHVRPEVFVIENVKNILTSENGYFKDQILDLFSSLGYIINFSVLNAKYYGVPENRERAIIVGSLNKGISLPEPNTRKFTTVKDAISDLFYLESGEGEYELPYRNAPLSEYQKKMRANSQLLYNHQATSHSELALKKLAMIPPEKGKAFLPSEYHGKQKFATTWSRLEWDNVSPTIDTRFDTPSNGKNSHPVLNRAITPREAARIQSFKDTFIFHGPKVAVCKQIGNAVPPLLGKEIGLSIRRAYLSNSVKTDNYELYLGDSYQLIKEFQRKGMHVNHIISDIPYNISKENNLNTLSSRKGVDFGEWDKDFDLYSWIGEYEKILDKNGSMIIFCSYLYLSHIIDKLKMANMDVKDVIVWKKSNPMPRNVERRYVQDMEFAVWAVKKNAKWIFNKPNDVPYLRSMFETSIVSGKERLDHPTQKSLALMERLVKIHTNPGDKILDPFMGVGSTGEAAIKNNRYFIGCELDEGYFESATKRLEKKVNSLI